jgi:hypothetical protein
LLCNKNVNFFFFKKNNSESHFKLRLAVRKICDSLAIEAREFEDAGTKPSDEFMAKMGENHLLAMNIGPGPHLHGMILPGGIKGEDFDYFHEVSIITIFNSHFK